MHMDTVSRFLFMNTHFRLLITSRFAVQIPLLAYSIEYTFVSSILPVRFKVHSRDTFTRHSDSRTETQQSHTHITDGPGATRCHSLIGCRLSGLEAVSTQAVDKRRAYIVVLHPSDPLLRLS